MLHGTSAGEYLVAQKDNDIAFVENITAANFPSENNLLWHVFDGMSLFLRILYLSDRQMYRPNEEVHIKGYIRILKFKSTDHFEKLGGLFIIAYSCDH